MTLIFAALGAAGARRPDDSGAGAFDAFGFSVALSVDGHTLSAGAFAEDSNAKGVGSDQTNNDAGFSGAAYVF